MKVVLVSLMCCMNLPHRLATHTMYWKDFINGFIHTFNKYLLNVYYGYVPCPREANSLGGEKSTIQ